MAVPGGIMGSPSAGGWATMPGGDNIQSIVDGSYGAHLESSFKEFIERPENRPHMEKHQQSEMRKAERLNRKKKAADFKEKVLESDYDAQKNIAPFLDNNVLRKIVQTFTNDPRNDFSKWANNPLVIRMLTQAKELLDEGRMSEEEAEHIILAQLKDPNNPAYHDFKLKTKQQVRLSTEQLVGALNEQIEERQKGNAQYKQHKFKRALSHYKRALAIVNFVVGMSSEDQKEVEVNKVACLLNIAAVHIALKDYGAAISSSTEALELDPKSIKALLRRAKAYGGRREYEAAQADLEKVKDLEPWNMEAEEEGNRLTRLRKKDLELDSQFSQGIFKEKDVKE
ncbi:hypothetical protein CYMTET_11721 [Cymbomonas tetramitiformis]|uniref:peptidylprolyl isomerase n=1 Tax=Cymbomonas tetramitiformis TaxID=36881 RepID=A0AAE0LCK4_9CHLO|nr:hypothetical protein CYMTET_11721 [Cymbomonas tetramitiformis]